MTMLENMNLSIPEDIKKEPELPIPTLEEQKKNCCRVKAFRRIRRVNS